MNLNIELNERPLQPVLSIRTRTSVNDLPKELGKAFGAIMQHLNEIGEQPTDAPFTAYYNMDMDNLDIEIGFPVSRPLQGKDEIFPGEIPAGKQISCIFKGPYALMEEVYKTMADWALQNDYSPSGVAYEFYYNSPADVPENELLTRVVFPVKK